MAPRNNETGLKIKRARELRGLTQEGLAEILGMTPHNVYLIESGRSDISIGKLGNIAKALEVPIQHLLPGNNLPVAVQSTDHKIIDMILAAIPGTVRDEHIAIEIADDSMTPAYRRGDRLVGIKRDPINCDGADCILEIQGKLIARRIYIASNGRFTLAAYNPLFPLLVDQKVEWAAPIEQVERRHASSSK